MEYDVFISHAWEDKDSFVRPLVEALQVLGLKVWYDEFSLEIGDSLSRSIDKGLSNSRYGIVVISKAFIVKPWTDYELRGLITKEVGREKVILPIWHEISKEEIIQFSPTLADKVALITTNLSTRKIAVRLLKQIRPDLHQTLGRRLILEKIIDNGEIVKTDFKNVEHSDIVHQTLPDDILVRLRIVYQIFESALDQSLDEFIENFQRDLRPKRELQQWEIMGSAFIDVTSKRDFSDAKKRDALMLLLQISVGAFTRKNEQGLENLTQEEINEIVEARKRAVPKI